MKPKFEDLQEVCCDRPHAVNECLRTGEICTQSTCPIWQKWQSTPDEKQEFCVCGNFRLRGSPLIYCMGCGKKLPPEGDWQSHHPCAPCPKHEDCQPEFRENCPLDKKQEPAFTPEGLARLFHATYERQAKVFEYQTRPETQQFNPESKNGKLMISVCREILTTFTARLKESK